MFQGVEKQATCDPRKVLLSIDGFKMIHTTLQMQNIKNKHEAWTLHDFALPATLAGKKVRLRFAFDSVDNLGNTSSG